MRCFFSAFVSSVRSVTFAMQASMKGVDGFENWYADIQAELRSSPIARFFHECRTDDQKIGFNHIVGGFLSETGVEFWFGEPEPGRCKFVPETDVLTTCKMHMRTTCAIVDKAYNDFGLEIDPDQIYTPDGLKLKSWSLEDVDEYLGYPRGWTDVEWPKGNKYEHRLASLVRNIPRSYVKPLLVKYLERELKYPIGPFRVRSD